LLTVNRNFLNTARILASVTTALICIVWFTNGLLCKILDLVPRHRQIVARILGDEYAWAFTKFIGVSEVLMVVWIVSRIKPRSCAIFQMTIVAVMNVIEFFLAPDLLLFGRLNIVFASLFITLIYADAFVIGKPNTYTFSEEP